MIDVPKILVVEDDQILGISIKKYLEKFFHLEVYLFSNSNDCLNFLKDSLIPFKFCLVTDISLEKSRDGLQLIDTLNIQDYTFVSIAMTGFASIETAIEATKKGVYQYLTKPFELDLLSRTIEQALIEKLSYRPSKVSKPMTNMFSHSMNNLRIEQPSEKDMFCGMIGRSNAMKKVFERIAKVASSDSTVLITGPSGTGKELVATAIHKLSQRSVNSRVSVNCGAIPADLLESELFGHVKGSFTGAIADRKGRFELADGGTLFLDEIGDMPLLLQVKLLRVLQTRQIEPVGSVKLRNVDTRIIAATHRNLESQVEKQKFREDLYYRLNVIPIQIPALKERKEDIPILIAYFLNKFVSVDGSNMVEFSPETFDLIMRYDWPGNVRELENLIERLVILRGGFVVKPEDLPAKIFEHQALDASRHNNLLDLPEKGVDIKELLSEIEDSLILQALTKTGGNKNKASKLLKLNRTTLIEKIKKKNLSWDDSISTNH